MPMVLRSRKSIHPNPPGRAGFEPGDPAPATPRRSTRLLGSEAARRAAYEESDESDSEPFQSQVMENHPSGPSEPEEEAAEEADLTELKHCKVVLDRLSAEDKAAAKELEEKEEMNQKGGKPVSRIPTFHKRPTNAGQSTELPVLKKDTPVHGAQPLQKAGSGSVETPKARPPDVRGTALVQPSIRAPRVSLESPSHFSGAEQAASAPKSWSFSGSDQGMTASPRPALRPEQGSEQHLPEQEKSKTSEGEADMTAVSSVSQLAHTGPLSQKPKEDTTEKFEIDPTSSIPLSVSGDTEQSESKHISRTTEISHVDGIMDEEPPWATEPGNALELKESRSSSDSECEEVPADQESQRHDLAQVDDHPKSDISKSETSQPTEEGGRVGDTPPHAPNKSGKARSSKATKSSGCSSFLLFFFLPTTLLLLGGFSQHIWNYGIPMSVAQLMAQLELHWLDGFGLMPEPCSTDCRVNLVESIPVGLYQSAPSSRHQSIADSWLHLLDKANSSVHIAAFYFTLRGSDLEFGDSTDSQGRRVFEHLKQLESRGINLQVAVNAPQTTTQDLEELGATGAEVREVNLQAVTGGIVHTKLWVVDQKHFYLGSANMDWRSLSQVKEVGLSVEDCSCLAQDAYRIFGVYWSIGGTNASLPPYWPARLSALSSSQNPLHLKFNGVPARVYLSSAPPQLSTRGRSDDLATILSVINDAQKFVYISVMDFLPLSEFTKPIRFWPPIDSALRAAGCTRGVQVRLMVSCWEHSPASMFTFLQSLLVLSRPPLKCDISVKFFKVPSSAEQKKIPFARVNHSKFMVTDRVLYIGTSNWSENYFTHTAGVGLVVNQTGSEVRQGQQTVQSQAEELFLRDWESPYASTLSVDDVDVCPRGRH
ncbi:hypothetical protein Q5P01_009336 [Channa striata]|uniref:PLD phosphodiesterase domain-containing protein n=1 Tax=Channa striata TaxID=64152 RepID=A0AA88N152_CHASR|nr:hypothetical protein Q5P01_009336 [Channa striata]